ncbi:MAG: hypothetical protein ACI31F_03055 [Muribaculaceae bacterium]
MSYECVVEEKCRGFITDFNAFVEIWNKYGGFHDAALTGLEFDEEQEICIVKLRCFDYKISFKFSRVRSISAVIPDFSSSYFYYVAFYVKPYCNYGDCIYMDADGELVQVIAEEMEVLEFTEL